MFGLVGGPQKWPLGSLNASNRRATPWDEGVLGVDLLDDLGHSIGSRA
jgi:hypothetical protein